MLVVLCIMSRKHKPTGWGVPVINGSVAHRGLVELGYCQPSNVSEQGFTPRKARTGVFSLRAEIKKAAELGRKSSLLRTRVDVSFLVTIARRRVAGTVRFMG